MPGEFPADQISFEGAIDLHCHFGPEPVVERIVHAPHSVDPLEAAREAASVGMRAIVLKAHEFASTAVAHLVNGLVETVEAISGICCDHPVGGLNPHAVETALRNGAGVVWLPTISAWTDRPDRLLAAFGTDRGLRVIDDNGRILPEVQEIMSLVIEHDAVLATGHTSAAEHYAVTRNFAPRGRLLVTHAMHQGTGAELNIQQCMELADLGAIIEFTAHSCMGKPPVFAQVVRAIQRVGIDRAVISSDYGFSTERPKPVPGLKGYTTALWAEGVTESDLRSLICDTPRRLLKLDEKRTL